jgi:hypothetical protein
MPAAADALGIAPIEWLAIGLAVDGAADAAAVPAALARGEGLAPLLEQAAISMAEASIRLAGRTNLTG